MTTRPKFAPTAGDLERLIDQELLAAMAGYEFMTERKSTQALGLLYEGHSVEANAAWTLGLRLCKYSASQAGGCGFETRLPLCEFQRQRRPSYRALRVFRSQIWVSSEAVEISLH